MNVLNQMRMGEFWPNVTATPPQGHESWQLSPALVLVHSAVCLRGHLVWLGGRHA